MTEQMLNNVMSYIKERHRDAAPFIRDNIQWTTTSTDKRIGYTRVTYSGESWTITMGHAITAEVIYDIRAEYKNEMLVWCGRIQDNAITEVDYSKK